MPGATRVIPIVLLVALLIAVAPRALRLADVDPRGRASWTAPPLTLGLAPQDIALFIPACDARAIVLHAATPAPPGRVAAEFFVPTTGGSTPHAGSASAAASPDGRVVLPVEGMPVPWRAPLIARLRALDQPIRLDGRQPIVIEPAPHSPLGTLACVSGAGNSRPGWLLLGALVVITTGSAVIGASWVRRALRPHDPGTRRAWAAVAAGVAMTSVTLVTYVLVVPPFEPADELAHFQYARFVATTGALPHEVPAPGSEWRASAYEFVQQPLYYLGAAGILQAAGLASPGPDLTANPRSRLQPGGTEPTLFEHARATAVSTAHRALFLLRLTSLLMAVATTVLIARLAATVSNDPLVVTTVAGGLGLIPQWCSVMGSVSTDPPATLLAAAATLAIVRLARPDEGAAVSRDRWCLLTGLLIGAAYTTKATTVFLLPMAGLACVLDAFRRTQSESATRLTAGLGRAIATSVRPLSWIALGVVLAAAWVPMRAWMVFGDPQAFGFKKAILEAGGFVPVAGPMPWTGEFWSHMRVMVFEPFWARFGSLGAGPFPGSRVWWVYGATSIVLVLVAMRAVVTWTRAGARAVRVNTGLRDAWAMLAVVVCAVGVGAGLLAWVGVNLLPRADMVVHWTPRHIMPLTAPAALLVAAGLDGLGRARPVVRVVTAAATGLLLPALAVAWSVVLRATILTFHFGY